MNELRRTDFIYRFFYPLVQILARFNRAVFKPFLPALGHDIQAAGFSRFWLPEEYLARIELMALFLGPAWIYVCTSFLEGGGRDPGARAYRAHRLVLATPRGVARPSSRAAHQAPHAVFARLAHAAHGGRFHLPVGLGAIGAGIGGTPGRATSSAGY